MSLSVDDGAVRLFVVAVVAIVLIGLALATRRWQRPSHPRIDAAGLDLPSGAVTFTSTDCPRCKEALAVLRDVDVPLREVTWELEPGVLERAGVTTVPLTAFVGADGAVVDQIVGVPSQRRLRAALAALRAGGGT